MKYVRAMTRESVAPARAESLLVKQAQLEVLEQAVTIVGDVVAIVKGSAEGAEEG